MIEHELTGRSPLRAFDPPGESAAAGRTALVVARAGTGKTAFLVQVAIDALLRGQPVLHASWGETLAHVKSWYEGVWRDLCAGLPAAAARVAWERFEPRRMLMTFRAGSGTVERLVERLATLEEDGGFAPRLLVVDGFRLDEKLRADAERLAKVAGERSLDVWLAARTPHDTDDAATAAAPVAELFGTIVALEPGPDAVTLRPLKAAATLPTLRLDPRTMLLARG